MKIGNVENLVINKEYMNYSKLCEALGVSKKPNKHKQWHIAELSRYCKINCSFGRYTITEIYNTPLTYEEIEHLLPNTETLNITDKFLIHELNNDRNNFNSNNPIVSRLDTRRYWWKLLGSDVYIYASPKERLVKPYEIFSYHTKNTYKEASKSARLIFQYLSNRKIKYLTEHSFVDLLGVNGGLLRFDFAILGDNDELLGLIEYDGEFHDEHLNPDIENYKVLNNHDKRKDTYCKENNIPLLRIHHSEFSNYMSLLENFLVSIGMKEVLKFDEDIKLQYQQLIKEIESLHSFNDKDITIIEFIKSIIDTRNHCIEHKYEFDLTSVIKMELVKDEDYLNELLNKAE